MANALLIIRTKQILRGLVGIGLVRLVFLVGLIGFLGFALFMKASDESSAQYISIGFILLLALVQLRRGDKLFLKSHFANFRFVFLAEYTTLSIPVLFCFLFHGQWISMIELLWGLLIVIHLDLNPQGKSINTKLHGLIPSDCIEWKAGVRKQFFLVVPIWIIAACTSFFIGSVPIAVFVLGFSVFSFFERCEPFQILQSHELGAKKFLFHKVKRQILLFTIIIAPLLGLFLTFHFGQWYIPVVEFLIFIFLHIYVIMTKYAFYEPNIKSPAAQTLGGIGALGVIIPIFLPVVWLLTIYFYVKSVDKLNYYLNDYN